MKRDPMEQDDQDLRDPLLSRALRRALGDERAPEAWVDAALDASRASGTPVPPPEPLLPILLPYLGGGLVITGAAVGFALNPDLRAGTDRALRGLSTWLVSAPLSAPGAEAATLWGLLLAAPLFAALVVESTRGFADVRRWLR